MYYSLYTIATDLITVLLPHQHFHKHLTMPSQSHHDLQWELNHVVHP
jgi:hypothetical protein